ncbi:hypothetical protein [Nitratireductor aquibiodomus]|uniref:hypothetical protein n=1 Tax=Nitratireductor aquibiodomus TaxID=204799 RepID=UPI0004690575|nr:hypothetical protein [Nitratireductor aquibiodomus]
MNQFDPSHPIDEEFFEDVFLQEIDSWFSADIACCESCYKNFLATWPRAYYANSEEFQTSQIQLDLFYEGSRINSFFTWEQFSRLIQDLDCPRCGEKFCYTIFPYNLPFDIHETFEDDIVAINDIAQKTPFLLLKNEFALSVLTEVVPPGETVWRLG